MADLQRFQSRFGLSLNPQQQAAVESVEGPVLLLAVPGSGKTTVLVSRVGYMVYEKQIPPEQILTVTYTVSAARDMKARFCRSFGQEMGSRLEFRTINGLCSRVIRTYERLLGRQAFSLLEDTGAQGALLGELCRRQQKEFVPESTVKALQTAITYAKNQMLTREELETVEVEGVDFPALFQAYDQTLRQRQQMDYDDQMVYARQILLRYPEVLARFQDKYRYLSVDEAQDTSKIQHAILDLLAGKEKNIFLVGDEDQSIYGFRAAYPQALTQFSKRYQGAKVLYLEKNYRSTPQIVETAQNFIQKNRDRYPKHMEAVRPAGLAVESISLANRRAQYSYLMQVVQDCQEETAVLYRDNESALPLIDLLARKGISYRCRQVDSAFFTSRVVQDISNIIRFAQDPQSSALFLNIYYKLGAGIRKKDAEEAATQKGKGTILERLAENPQASAFTRRQCRALQTHLDHMLLEPGDKAVYRIVRFMGYGEYLQRQGMESGKAQILESLGAMEKSPMDLLRRLGELEDLVRQGGEPDCPFVLSTIHSSKGLEYDRVILMDVADGIFPRTGQPEPEDEEAWKTWEEERRLFYVAMTRARNRLQVFRFRHPEMESTFSQEIFPVKKPSRAPAALRPTVSKKPGTMAQRPAALEKKPQVLPAGAEQYYVKGAALSHRRFGPGIIADRQGDLVTVAFLDGSQRTFSLAATLGLGQFAPEK